MCPNSEDLDSIKRSINFTLVCLIVGFWKPIKFFSFKWRQSSLADYDDFVEKIESEAFKPK